MYIPFSCSNLNSIPNSSVLLNGQYVRFYGLGFTSSVDFGLLPRMCTAYSLPY